MVGSPAASVEGWPVITGNFLGADGKGIFRLVRNVLAVNRGGCSKIPGKQIGFEIHDAEGKAVLKVGTKFRKELGAKGMFVTTIQGTFYNAAGETVAGRGIAGALEDGCPGAFGFSGSWGMMAGISEKQLQFATACVLSEGAIHEVVTGVIQNQDIDLDGRIFVDATIKNCKCRIRYGNFMFQGKCSVTENKMEVLPPARNVYGFFRSDFLASQAAFRSGTGCAVPGKYQSAGCGHSNERVFGVGEAFGACPECGKAVAWVRMG